MANISAPRDNNRIPTLMGTSSADGKTPVVLYADPTTHRLYVDLTGGGTTTVDAGTTTTLSAGSSATVVNSGTITNAVFDFGIPRGNTGAAGAAGATGATGPIGMNWKGAWVNFPTVYAKNDGVSYLGSSYISKSDGNDGNVPTDTFWWDLIALKGTDGAGSVKTIGITTTNGVSGVSNGNASDPRITVTLGAITPSTVNGNTLTTGTGTITITGTKTLTVADTASVSGTNTGDSASIPIGYLDTTTTLGTSDVKVPSQNAVKVYADNILGNANALVYKGVIDCSTNPNYPAADAGFLYVVSVAGKIGGASGIEVEAGDMCICNTDSTASGDQATVGSKWNIIQKNIVGAVTGPASSIDNHVVFFDSTSGKIIKDSGLTLSGTNTGDNHFADSETPSGTVDGGNATFTVANTPSPAGSLQFFVNGQLLVNGGVDYTLTTNSIVAVSSPPAGSILRCWYRY